MTSFLDREATESMPNNTDSDSEGNDGDDTDTMSDEIPLQTFSRKKRVHQDVSTDNESEDAPPVRSKHGNKRRRSVAMRKSSTLDRQAELLKELNASNESQQSSDVLKAVQKGNELLLCLVKRVKKTEKRMKVVEQQLKSSTKSPSSGTFVTPSRTKKDVPDEVRRETRRVYHMLMEEDIENFLGWKIEPGVTYKDVQNQGVLDRLLREIKALNPMYLTQHIKDAAYRFYRSKCEEESSKRRGKHVEKVMTKRRHQRLLTKLNERKGVLAKGTFTATSDEGDWSSIMKTELMSSEESGVEGEDEVIIVHPLPWVSPRVKEFKRKIDEQVKKEKTPQAKRQMKKRVLGCDSLRPIPPGLPEWVVRN